MIDLTDLERLRAIGLAPHILSSLPTVRANDTLLRVVVVVFGLCVGVLLLVG